MYKDIKQTLTEILEDKKRVDCILTSLHFDLYEHVIEKYDSVDDRYNAYRSWIVDWLTFFCETQLGANPEDKEALHLVIVTLLIFILFNDTQKN